MLTALRGNQNRQKFCRPLPYHLAMPPQGTQYSVFGNSGQDFLSQSQNCNVKREQNVNNAVILIIKGMHQAISR
jgi:hypothetical protein